MIPLILGAVAAASAGAQVVGSLVSAGGYSTMAEGEAEQSKAQLKAERIRHRQMRLDFMRQRREVIRQSLVARSTLIAESVAKGAEGDSSVTTGLAGVATQQGRSMSENKQNESLGDSLFKANMDYFRAGGKIAQGQGQVAMGQGISNIGAAFGNSIGPISRLGSLATGGSGA